MRAMDHERLEILTGADGTLVSAAQVPPSGRERLTQVDTQLPKLLRRHRCCTTPFFSSTPGSPCWCRA
jgi:hypothetical protein